VIPQDGTAARSGRAAVRDREDAVVTRLHQLAPHLDGEPDPTFRAATRARLVAMAAVRTPAPAPASGLRRLLTARAADSAPARWRTRLTAGLAGAALTVTALATVVAVAADARPGDVLYGLKRGTEHTQLALAGESSRGQTLLGFASTRLDEVRDLVGGDATALPVAGAPAGSSDAIVLAAGADPALVVQTLDTMDAQTTDGAAWLTDRAVTTEEAGPLEDLAGWAAGQSAGLAALRAEIPPAAGDAVDASLVLLADVQTRAVALRSALDCAAGPATAGVDDLGPVPTLCVPEQPAPPVADGSRSTPGSVPGTATAPRTTPSIPSVPPGGGTGAGDPGSSGAGGGLGVPTPAGPVPSGVLPTPPLPLPLPTALPAQPDPGTPGVGPVAPPPPLVHLDVCLGPISIGDC
jgi:hypothetical protein